jgi:2,3-dihydroxybenzoate-AMP ligase
MAEEIKSESECLEYIFIIGEPNTGQIGLDEMLDQPAEDEGVKAYLSKFRPDPGEVALMMLSGGTTAMPKLIPRTHNDYVYNSKASGAVANFNEETVYLTVLPVAHNFALASPGVQAAFFSGGTVVLSPAIDEETVFSLIAKEKVTVTSIMSTFVAMWIKSPVLGKYDLSSLKLIIVGGGRISANLRQRLMDEFQCIYMESFGTGEGLLNKTRLDDTEEHILNSSGAPVCDDDEIKVIDENGNELPDGVPGELIVRGPYTIRGYYNVPETNRNAFTKDGFYRMGDMVSKVGRYIYSEGRIKDLISRAGEKISCEEVEGFISAHPKVKSVCLVAMPDEVYGEKGCAFVILQPNETLTFEELIDFLLKRNIAKFKLPERLEVVDSFPLSNVGKFLKRTLREQIAQKLAEEKLASEKKA